MDLVALEELAEQRVLLVAPLSLESETQSPLSEQQQPSEAVVAEEAGWVDAGRWKGQAFCLIEFLMVHLVEGPVQAGAAGEAWGLLEHFASVAFEIPQDGWLPVGRSIQWLRVVPSRVPPVLAGRLV